MIDQALQITLVVLLFLTITWCVIVHHRLRRLRVDGEEMAAFITALSKATTRAEDAVRHMHEANREVAAAAREQQRCARQQSDDLARLMDNAVRVIKRLDFAVERSATRVAELRTRPAGLEKPEREQPTHSKQAPPVRAAAGTLPDRDARSGPGGPELKRGQQVAQPVRGDGQLEGLLHGDLREALQGLR